MHRIMYAGLSICEVRFFLLSTLPVDLGLEPPKPTQRHVIIVTQVGEQIVGLLVDAVSDILSITDQKLQPTPDVASETAKAFVKGLLTVDDRMIRYIALESILPARETSSMNI